MSGQQKALFTPKDMKTTKTELFHDPVAGSGTTLIAAHNLGRDSYGFECNNKFYHDGQKLIQTETAQMNLMDFMK